jgi:hypothetical protein
MKDIDDNEAFMQLVLCNPQGELSPLELRLDVLAGVRKPRSAAAREAGFGAYVEQAGKGFRHFSELRQASEVFRVFTDRHGPSHMSAQADMFSDNPATPIRRQTRGQK